MSKYYISFREKIWELEKAREQEQQKFLGRDNNSLKLGKPDHADDYDITPFPGINWLLEALSSTKFF